MNQKNHKEEWNELCEIGQDALATNSRATDLHIKVGGPELDDNFVSVF